MDRCLFNSLESAWSQFVIDLFQFSLSSDKVVESQPDSSKHMTPVSAKHGFTTWLTVLCGFAPIFNFNLGHIFPLFLM